MQLLYPGHTFMMKMKYFQCTDQLLAACIQVKIYYCQLLSEKLTGIVRNLKRMKLNALMKPILSHLLIKGTEHNGG